MNVPLRRSGHLRALRATLAVAQHCDAVHARNVGVVQLAHDGRLVPQLGQSTLCGVGRGATLVITATTMAQHLDRNAAALQVE
jgi:hypothetical protein